jgi:hypothetical protein
MILASAGFATVLGAASFLGCDFFGICYGCILGASSFALACGYSEDFVTGTASIF